MRRLFQLALAATTLALAGPAAAQAEKAQAATAPQAAAPAASTGSSAASAPSAPRVRASHRVDVIAPGEKVETVIDRLRASRAAAELAAPGPAPASAAAPRAARARGVRRPRRVRRSQRARRGERRGGPARASASAARARAAAPCPDHAEPGGPHAPMSLRRGGGGPGRRGLVERARRGQSRLRRGRLRTRRAAGAPAAVPPDQRPALYLAGLSRFRLGRARRGPRRHRRGRDGADAPAAWHFNRGACLYALGRLPEAETEFLFAAPDPAFATLALVQAGFAALDAGAAIAPGPTPRARAPPPPAGSSSWWTSSTTRWPRRPAGPPRPRRPTPAAAALGGGRRRGSRLRRRRPAGRARQPGARRRRREGRQRPGARQRLGRAPAPGRPGHLRARLRLRPARLPRRRSPGPERAAARGRPGGPRRATARAPPRGERGRRPGAGRALRPPPPPVLGRPAGRRRPGPRRGRFIHLDLGATWKRGWSEFGYLGGHRLEAGLWEELRWGGTRLRAGYRARLERIGELRPPSATTGTRPPATRPSAPPRWCSRSRTTATSPG